MRLQPDEAGTIHRLMTKVAVAVVTLMVLFGSGCSGDESNGRRVLPETPAPSAAQAKRAIQDYSRFNVTGPARFISGCRSSDGATTCSVDYRDECQILAVTTRAGKLKVAQASGGVCLHAGDFTTQASTVP
jgi:hypothetical protein